MRIFAAFIFTLAIGNINAQEVDFWKEFDAYCQVGREHAKRFEIHAYKDAETKEVMEASYGEFFRKGEMMMLKLPQGLQVMNGDLAVQVTEPNKMVMVTLPLKENTKAESFDYVAMLRKLKMDDVLEFEETDAHFVLRTKAADYGEYRQFVWYFAKGKTFELVKTVLYFNKVNMVNSTTEGGDGQEYSLDDPRVEVKFENRPIELVRVEDIIQKRGDELILTSAYSNYQLIDMSDRYEATSH